MEQNFKVHQAYSRIEPNYSRRLQELEQSLDQLLGLGRQSESQLLRKFKPAIVLSLKWKFDFLCKTLGSPFELEEDVRYWIRILEILKVLGDEKWFDFTSGEDSTKEPWRRTAQGFDLGWTTTTDGDQFEISKKIAQERLDQIIEMLGGAGFFEGKNILDSGCGPGRYVDLMRQLNPKGIVAMDQGERLVNVLNERFKDDPKVDVQKGTCEKLTYLDESFDIVFSNGVIHHTSADLETMIRDHARVLRNGGVMFIMLVGKGGLELKMWEFVRNFLYDIPMPEMLDSLKDAVSPLRMQGIVDHMYGEYQQTSQEEFENWCSPIFTKIERVPGILGLDVTKEIYEDDPYFYPRFGCGQLRYLCTK